MIYYLIFPLVVSVLIIRVKCLIKSIREKNNQSIRLEIFLSFTTLLVISLIIFAIEFKF